MSEILGFVSMCEIELMLVSRLKKMTLTDLCNHVKHRGLFTHSIDVTLINLSKCQLTLVSARDTCVFEMS